MIIKLDYEELNYAMKEFVREHNDLFQVQMAQDKNIQDLPIVQEFFRNAGWEYEDYLKLARLDVDPQEKELDDIAMILMGLGYDQDFIGRVLFAFVNERDK